MSWKQFLGAVVGIQLLCYQGQRLQAEGQHLSAGDFFMKRFCESKPESFFRPFFRIRL